MTARYTDNGTNDRPDWSNLMPGIRAMRNREVNEASRAFAAGYVRDCYADFDVDLTDERILHALLVGSFEMVSKLRPTTPGSAVLNELTALVALVPEDVR